MKKRQENVKDIVTYFYQEANKWFVKSDSDCVLGTSLDDEVRGTFRSNFNIGLDETILFARDTSFWSSRDQGLVITDKGFYVIPDNDDLSQNFTCSWGDIAHVIYQELWLYFYANNNKEQWLMKLPMNYFIKCNDSEKQTRIWTEKGPKIAEALTNVSKLVEADVNPFDLIDEGRYDDAIKIAEEQIRSNANDWDAHVCKAYAIKMKEEAKEEGKQDNEQLKIALHEFEKAIQLMPEGTNESTKARLFYDYGEIYYTLEDYWSARKAYILALEGFQNCDDLDWEKSTMVSIDATEASLEDYWDNYTTYFEYKQRKYIMPVKDSEIGGCIADDIDVFRISEIPSCIKFPTGHPVANQLYIGHPYNSSLYVPVEESDDLFFLDKVHELRYLLECLGAEEISITSIKGRSVNELNDYDATHSGNTDIKLFSGEGTINKHSRKQSELTSHNQRTMTIKLDPMTKPFVPNDLIWYEQQPQWKRLVNSRLNGNMLEYSELVSTSQTNFTNKTEKKEVKASAKYLWNKLGIDVEQTMEEQFKETTETQWKVEVKFRSVKNFANAVDTKPQTSQLEQKQTEENTFMNEDEQSYAEEVKFCLEDGQLGDKERRFLERMRTKLGISPERARHIEDSLQQPQFTDSEQEYLEAIKEEMTDGTILASSRRLLDRLRKSMDISPERAIEIEEFAIRTE